MKILGEFFHVCFVNKYKRFATDSWGRILTKTYGTIIIIGTLYVDGLVPIFYVYIGFYVEKVFLFA